MAQAAHMADDDGRRDAHPLSRLWAYVPLAMVSCALWGSAFAFVKLGYELFAVESGNTAQQLLFAGMRFTLAGVLVLAGTALVRHRLPLPSRADVAPIIFLALSQTVVQYACFYIGLAHASGTNSSLVQGTSAFVQIVLASLVFGQEQLTVRKLVGCALGLGGVALVVLRGGGMVGSWSAIGEGLILGSVVAGGVSTCLTRKYGMGGDPLLLTGWQFALGGIALCLGGLAAGGRVAPSSPAAFGILLYLGALSASAFSIWSLLLKHNPVSRVAMYRFLIPIFGVLFSATFLGEVVPAGQLPSLVAALALIVCGTILVNTERA